MWAKVAMLKFGSSSKREQRGQRDFYLAVVVDNEDECLSTGINKRAPLM